MSRFQHPRIGRFQDFRDSMQNTWSYKVAIWETWPSHADEGIQPLNGEQQKLFPYPNGPGPRVLDGQCLLVFQEGHEAPTKDFKLKRHQHVHWTNAFQGLLSPYAGCWGNMKHVSCHESSFHIHHPIPFPLQAHNCFILLLVLSHKHYLMRFVNPLENCTLLDVLHNDSYMIASWLMDFQNFLNAQICWTYLYCTLGNSKGKNKLFIDHLVCTRRRRWHSTPVPLA